MKRHATKVVNYSRSFKDYVVHAIVRDGLSIATVCSQSGIDEMYKVREWVREYMSKRGLTRIPRTLTRRKNAPQAFISEPVNRQFQRYEEIIMYQEKLIEALYQVGNEELKKKLLQELSPTQRKNLKNTGKLRT